MGTMKIILYPSANPDRHGPIGKVIEVDAAKGNRLIGSGLARVIEHDRPPPSQPTAKLVEVHLANTGTQTDDQDEVDEDPEEDSTDPEPFGDFRDE